MIKKVIFNKIQFLNFSSENFKKIINKKGTFFFPAAPALATIDQSEAYYKSLKKANHVFLDSGFFVLLLRLFKNINVKKFSGFKFIKLFLSHLKKNKKNNIFLIDPNRKISHSYKKYFMKFGIKKVHSYIAPIYPSADIVDKKLVNQINKTKPKFILINLGGTKQEILGDYLNSKLKNKYPIICTGAALSFFTRDQAPINTFFDEVYLGWLIRIIFNPKVFLKRYLLSLKLLGIFIKYFDTIEKK
jgi:N-acetylglucosaminyldiphosphoundecaprenol N-acetyl-beta-D-mannosaminyltransferase